MTQTSVRPFKSSLEHLLEALALLDLRLLHEVQRVRQSNAGGTADEFRGLLVSEEQIQAILSDGLILGAEGGPGPESSPLVRQRQDEFSLKVTASRGRGVPLRLEQLRALFHLDPWDLQVITLCLAPEISLRYEVLYAYLQDDVGKKRPTVDLALRLFCTTLADRMARRCSFIQPAPMVKCELVQFTEDPYSKDRPFLGQALRLDYRIVNYLLGSDELDSRLLGLAHLEQPETSWEEVVLPPVARARLEALTGILQAPYPGQLATTLQLVGPQGTGKKTVARSLSHDLERPLMVADCKALLAAEMPPDQLIRLVFREALLQDAVLCWDNFHLVLGDDPQQRASRDAFDRELAQRPDLTILCGELPWRPESGLDTITLLDLQLTTPEYPERKRLWEGRLNGRRGQLTDEDLGLVAGKFRFSGGQIRRVVATARDLARWRWQDGGGITLEDLHAASRWHSGQGLALLAQKVLTRYSWEDIVLPPDQKAQLREICSYFANMPLVYGEWGFQRKSSLGKGLNVLFAGPSGTGKTMAAEIMAGELGLDLYKIDLSSIVSKYIGETEKNLDRIFREAQDSNAILFFDEADALFGKRSEVRDSHDRYANIEISYLLQKMEEYQGIVILATNFRKNMDDAFVRRLHFALEFPFPEEEYRLQIWRQVFPPEAPLDESIDLPFLARQFKVAGGNIRNMAVAAGFLAAQQREPIGMKHIIWATKREYQKIGRLLLETEFGPYFDLVKG